MSLQTAISQLCLEIDMWLIHRGTAFQRQRWITGSKALLLAMQCHCSNICVSAVHTLMMLL